MSAEGEMVGRQHMGAQLRLDALTQTTLSRPRARAVFRQETPLAQLPSRWLCKGNGSQAGTYYVLAVTVTRLQSHDALVAQDT
jgi:hypothetical protein